MEKRVLILAWDFPPYTAIGAARPNSWYRNFKQNGIEPVVITRHWDDDNNFKDAYIRSSSIQEKTITENEYGTLIQVPYKASYRDRLILKHGYNKYRLLRKFISFSQQVMSFPSAYFDVRNIIYEAAEEYLKNNKVDLILATGEPFILHKYAYQLSKKFKTDYVLDYRDGWTTRDDNLDSKGLLKFLNNVHYRRYEKKFLKHAALVTTSNPFEGPKLKSLLPDLPVENFFNGYVEEEIDYGAGVEQLSDFFRIGYAGTIYPYNRVEDFLEGMKLFVAKYPDAKFRFMLLGIESQQQQLARIKNYHDSLIPFVESTPRMEKMDLIQWFCKCNSLLIFTSPNIKLLPSKIYEYLPLKRRILVSVNDKADIEMIMNTTNAGDNCNNAEEIFQALDNMYQEFLANGKVTSAVSNYEQFSRREQAKLLAERLNNLNCDTK